MPGRSVKTQLECLSVWILTVLGGTVAAAAIPQEDGGDGSPKAQRPNILFIAIDDLRPSIGCYGDAVAHTPNIDRLAANGVQFVNAHCQVAVCNPSRASLMTGLRPDSLGVWTLPIHFREAKPDAVTLPQWLRKFGYTAVSHGKIYHNPTPDPQSWSEAIRPAGKLAYPYPKGTRERVAEVEAGLPDGDWRENNLRGPATAAPDVEDNELIDGRRTDMALEDLDRLSQQSEPFFLAVGFIRPHLAWIAPKKYWDKIDPATLPVKTDGEVTPDTPPYALSTSYELTHYMDLVDFPKPTDARRVSPEQARHLMHAYYASVAYIDAQIGRLMDRVEKLGISDNTIVILWSDHGWKLGEFNGWGKMSNYEIDTRVPLLVSAPGKQLAGSQSVEMAELVDLFPTICDLVDVPKPEFLEGESLAANLKDPSLVAQEAAYSQYYRRWEGEEYIGYAMRTPDFRYVQWRLFSNGELQAEELYDHRNDSAETRNLAHLPEHVDTLINLRTRLDETHPPKALNMVPVIHSRSLEEGNYPAGIRFENRMEVPVEVYPINPAGRRGRVRRIAPGGTVGLRSRIGAVFVVESKDGKLYQIHSPAVPRNEVILQLPDATVIDDMAGDEREDESDKSSSEDDAG